MKPSGVRGAWLAGFLSRSISKGLDLPAPDIAVPPRSLSAHSRTPSAKLDRRFETAPHARGLVLGLDRFEQARVLGELFRARRNDDEGGPVALGRPGARDRARRLELDRQAVLAAGHREVDLGEQRGVEQRAVQRAVSVVHLIALAQGVQGVLPARM